MISEAPGVLSGLNRVLGLADEWGLEAASVFEDGETFDAGAELVRVTGPVVSIIKCEERIIGLLSKTSGIATAARQAHQIAGPNLRVVSGGFKKLPFEIKDAVRQAVLDGGLDIRMLPPGFLYLDKNYVRILGGVKPAIQAVAELDRPVVIQVRGESATVEEEAVAAAEWGAAVVMVDTGRKTDIARVSRALQDRGLRDRVELAFAGNIKLTELLDLKFEDVDALDIGYAIIDAPCIPLRFDVLVGW